jgi:hypothetical protein
MVQGFGYIRYRDCSFWIFFMALTVPDAACHSPKREPRPSTKHGVSGTLMGGFGSEVNEGFACQKHERTRTSCYAISSGFLRRFTDESGLG